MTDNTITNIEATTDLRRFREHVAARMSSPLVARRVADLERDADGLTARAARAGVHIDYRGIAPIFKEPVAYAGDGTDWVIGPMRPADRVIPRKQQLMLKRLDDAAMRFPALYFAHEVPKGVAFERHARNLPVRQLERGEVDTLVGSAPPPASTVELATRMGSRAQLAMTAILNGSKAVGTAALAALSAPVVMAGAAASALATLDPIVFGVIPAVSHREGEPSAWYVLARWEW